jgi:hypothetical protein
MGHVGHNPRLSGPGGHKPQTDAPPAVRAAIGHTANVASITRRRAELARRLWDLSKMALGVLVAGGQGGIGGLLSGGIARVGRQA